MRRFGLMPRLALVLAVGMLNGGCILVPEIEDRVVELAVAGTTSTTFTVQGTTTTVDEIQTVDINAELNLAQILTDNGIDVSKVTHIALSSVQYRIVRADHDPNLQLTGGTITIQRGIGLPENLVTSLAASPGAVSGYQNVTLEQAGVLTIDDLLADLLTELQGGPPIDPTVTLRLTGNSSGPTDFDFELKVTISITGTVEVSVPT